MVNFWISKMEPVEPIRYVATYWFWNDWQKLKLHLLVCLHVVY